MVLTTGWNHIKKESWKDDTGNTRKPPADICNQQLTGILISCRPFRTHKMMMAVPVAEATGYNIVPLQGTIVDCSGLIPKEKDFYDPECCLKGVYGDLLALIQIEMLQRGRYEFSRRAQERG